MENSNAALHAHLSAKKKDAELLGLINKRFDAIEVKLNEMLNKENPVKPTKGAKK